MIIKENLKKDIVTEESIIVSGFISGNGHLLETTGIITVDGQLRNADVKANSVYACMVDLGRLEACTVTASAVFAETMKVSSVTAIVVYAKEALISGRCRAADVNIKTGSIELLDYAGCAAPKVPDVESVDYSSLHWSYDLLDVTDPQLDLDTVKENYERAKRLIEETRCNSGLEWLLRRYLEDAEARIED